MATSVTTSLPMWLAGCTYDANSGNDLRNSMVTALFFDPGIVTSSTVGVRSGVIGGSGLFVQPGTGMTVTVQPGSFVVAVSSNPIDGAYVSTLASQATLTVQTADPSNPRIDIIVANVVDNGNSTSFGEVQIITGVAAASPAAPSAPSNSITLAQLSVPAGTSTITSGLLTDQRPFTGPKGSVLVAPKGSVTGYLGQLAYDKTSGSFYHNNNLGGSTQMHVLPWAPVEISQTFNFNWTGAESTVLSGSFSADGYTDVQIQFKWPGVSSNVGSGSRFTVLFRLYIDSTQVDSFYTNDGYADGAAHGGGSWSYFTSSTTGDTSSAGSHTFRVSAQNMAGTGSTTVYGYPGGKLILRAEPVAM